MEILDKTGVSIMWSAIKDKYALKTSIPTKTSELINDSSFLDSAVTTGTGNVLTDLTVVNNQLQFTKGTVDTSSAESASKLTTARTIWGQSFDGTADVSGDITLDGSIISSDTLLVDLGLSSGTLWMNRNVGASSPEDAGLYFAWGETQGYTADKVGLTKQFQWSDYKFGTATNLTKYNSTDGLTTLEATDDSVLQNIYKCSMPTKTQIQELLDNTTQEYTRFNDVYGITFTSMVNGASIFIPMAGAADHGSVSNVNSVGYLWSSSLKEDNTNQAWVLQLSKNSFDFDYANRYRGYSVRGVATLEETINIIDLPSASGTLALTNDVEAVKNYIPTKVSQLTNDAGYLTEHQALKTINGESLVGTGDITIDLSLYIVVSSLPTSDINSNKIYLVDNSSGDSQNTYTEYIYTGDTTATYDSTKWEKLGEYRAEIDLSEYLKATTAESTYAKKTDLPTSITATAVNIVTVQDSTVSVNASLDGYTTPGEYNIYGVSNGDYAKMYVQSGISDSFDGTRVITQTIKVTISHSSYAEICNVTRQYVSNAWSAWTIMYLGND